MNDGQQKKMIFVKKSLGCVFVGQGENFQY